jgi:hypothetical protein
MAKSDFHVKLYWKAGPLRKPVSTITPTAASLLVAIVALVALVVTDALVATAVLVEIAAQVATAAHLAISFFANRKGEVYNLTFFY